MQYSRLKKTSMKDFLVKFSLLVNCIFANQTLNAQCDVKSEVSPTGVFIETTKKEIIYFNNQYSIFSQVKHDGDDFFLVIRVNPMVKKDKYTGTMNIILENKDSVNLIFYDVKTRSKDTSISLFYKIESDQINELTKYGVSQIVMDFDQVEKTFILELHKDVIMNQIKCLRKEEEEKEKVKGKE